MTKLDQETVDRMWRRQVLHARIGVFTMAMLAMASMLIFARDNAEMSSVVFWLIVAEMVVAVYVVGIYLYTTVKTGEVRSPVEHSEGDDDE